LLRSRYSSPHVFHGQARSMTHHRTIRNRTESPNNALQRTRSAVTACAPNHRHLSTHPHRPRLLRASLSLGALGVCHAHRVK
jgi:hypothetical protein